MTEPDATEPEKTERDAAEPEVFGVDTPLGPARVHRFRPRAQGPLRSLVLGHGAGGGVDAPDLQAVAAAAVRAGWQVVLVEQPWRVAGRKVAPAPPRLDQGWLAVLGALAATDNTAADGAAGVARIGPGGADGGARVGPGGLGTLVVGGRSAGARVACRTARELGAIAVLALSFPLHPPGRPERSRATELTSAGVDTLVVQGQRDPFGRPTEFTPLLDADPRTAIRVVSVPGDHSLREGAAAAATATLAWFARLRAS